VVEAFLKKRGFTRFGLFVQDYGGPVGFRILSRNPDWLEWLIIQNTNAYEVGFTAAWEGLRNALWKNRTPETEKPILGFLELDTIKSVSPRAQEARADQPGQLEHGLSIHGAAQGPPGANGSLLRLPHQRRALSSPAKAAMPT
jgi:pimeloyl-ACP methyl ester carboxylesterase